MLAARRKPAGSPRASVLRFTTTGEVERPVRVQGRLYLTRADGGWQVFGYDITKGRLR